MDIVACTSVPVVIRRITLTAINGKSIPIGPNNDGFEVSSSVAEKLAVGKTYIIVYIPYTDLRVRELLFLAEDTGMELIALVGKNSPWQQLCYEGDIIDSIMQSRHSR